MHTYSTDAITRLVPPPIHGTDVPWMDALPGSTRGIFLQKNDFLYKKISTDPSLWDFFLKKPLYITVVFTESPLY
jgi:hypothetical protein